MYRENGVDLLLLLFSSFAGLFSFVCGIKLNEWMWVEMLAQANGTEASKSSMKWQKTDDNLTLNKMPSEGWDVRHSKVYDETKII